MSYQCQGLGMGSARPCWEQHLALGHGRRDALGPGTLLLLGLGGFILNPAIFVVPSPLGSEHSELGILWGVGGTGSPRGCANEIKGVFTGRRKEEAGVFSGAQNLVSCSGSGKHRLLSLAGRKLGASGGLEAWLCPLPAPGQGLGVCFQNICCPQVWGDLTQHPPCSPCSERVTNRVSPCWKWELKKLKSKV